VFFREETPGLTLKKVRSLRVHGSSRFAAWGRTALLQGREKMRE